MFGNSVVSADQTGHPVVAADQSNIISQDPESLLVRCVKTALQPRSSAGYFVHGACRRHGEQQLQILR